MIHDSLAARDLYAAIHPGLRAAFDFLARENLMALPSGTIPIDGERLFAMVNDYTTKPAEQCRFEAHRRYTDLQYMVQGEERIDFAHIESLALSEPHSLERDVAFFQGQGDALRLRAGQFAIFFSHDAHRPGIALNAPIAVRKIVLKIELAQS